MVRCSPEVLSILIASMLAVTGCQRISEPEPASAEDAPTPTKPPTATPFLPTPTIIGAGIGLPTPTFTPEAELEVAEVKTFLVEQEMGLPEIVSLFPIFDDKDPYYPWYRWNGGERLFDPLAIPAGTVLTVPNSNLEPPPLPEITISPEKWQYKLAEHTTSLAGSSENRLFNIRLGTERLNGTIVAPYQLFSIERAIGPTNLSGGYVMGWGYLNGEEVPMEGGGVCQIPSTLFKPAAEAGMLVIQRYAHMFYSDRYGPWDATISPILDFTFRNLYDFPVQIRAEISNDNQFLIISVWSPFASPYNMVELESLYNQEYEDGSRDAAVRQRVILNGRERIREYYSHYDPKP